MTFEELSQQLTGNWNGEYMLHISPDEPQLRSKTIANIQRVVLNRFVKFDYTWEYEGKTQEGLLLIGYDKIKEKVRMSWIDSWHQQTEFMISEGPLDSNNILSAKGSFEVSEGPDWGWRTTIILKSSDSFTFEMYNITPDGQEHLGVQVEYSKNN